MFHVNNDGKAMKCRAKTPENCKFYKGEDDSRHYETIEEANAGVEEISRREAEQNGNVMGTLKKDSQGTDDFNFGTVDKQDRTKKMVENLDKAIEKLVANGDLAKYLDAIAKNGKNKWTFSNVAIAAMQLESYRRRNGLPVEDNIYDTINNMDACGAKQWNERGRKITSGKGSALYILAPMIGKKDVLDANGKPQIGADGKPLKTSYVYGFRGVPVFDKTQTDGDPIPENPIKTKAVTQEIEAKYVESMKKAVEDSGYEYSEKPIARDAEKLEGTLGYTSPQDMSVVVDSRLSNAQKAAVLSHELAHIKLGHVTKEGMQEYQSHRGRMETEAESLAYMLMQRAGLDEKEGEAFSPGYIAGWSKGDMSTVRTALNKATSVFGKMMEELKWD